MSQIDENEFSTFDTIDYGALEVNYVNYDPQPVIDIEEIQRLHLIRRGEPYTGKFRTRAKNFTLTASQCLVSPGDALAQWSARLESAGTEISQYVISQEEHKDKGLHLHAFISVPETFSVTHPRFFELYLAGTWYQVNLQQTKSKSDWIEYVVKDGNYITNMNIKAKRKARENKKKYVGEVVIARGVVAAIEEDASVLYDAMRLHTAHQLYNRLKTHEVKELPTFLENPWGLLLPSQLYYVDSISGQKRKEKRRHIWIWSEKPNTRKSTGFLNPLVEAGYGVIQTDLNSYSVEAHHSMVAFDDYQSAMLKIGTINTMCDGSFQYNMKYQQPLKLDSPMIIVCSNKPPERVYTKEYELIYARFRVYRVDVDNVYRMSPELNNLIFASDI